MVAGTAERAGETNFIREGWDMRLMDRFTGECLGATALVLTLVAAASAELPRFEDDQQADRWLREHSDFYRRMADGVDRRGGYEIRRTVEYPGGVAYTSKGRGYIELNDALQGGHRVSVLIFEMTNLHQEHRHQEVAQRVRTGTIDDPIEFALLREMIEYDGLHMHHSVLREIEPHVGRVPPEMLDWVCVGAHDLASYRPPWAYDYLQAQRASGHTSHYLRLFEKHRAEFRESKADRQAVPAVPQKE